MGNKTLNEELYNEILELSKKGEQYFEDKEFYKAIALYKEALEKIPYPVYEWDASTWLYTAMGDCYFLLSDYKEALSYFLDAYNCPGGIGNPFINLRLGQCYYEKGDLLKAEDYLLRSYMLEGIQIFDSENKKYYEYLNKKFDLD